MTYRAIPKPAPGSDPALLALKENFEVLTGQRGAKTTPLSETATLSEVISKLNEVIARLS